MKKKPIGFVATCQCGNVIGAADYERTGKKEIGKILGKWLADGCTVEPRFSGFVETIGACECDYPEASKMIIEPIKKRYNFILAGSYKSFKDFARDNNLNPSNAVHVRGKEILYGFDGHCQELRCLKDFFKQNGFREIIESAKSRGFNIKYE